MLKQIILVNIDLKMGIGKIVAQACHAEVMYMKKIYSEGEKMVHNTRTEQMLNNHINWQSETSTDQIGMMKKVVLKSTESNIRDYFIRLRNDNIWCYVIFDKGLTQVTPGSLTCLIVEPLEEEKCNELFGDLKLL